MEISNPLNCEDRERIKWLYSHDLVNFDIAQKILKQIKSEPQNPVEFNAKKIYRNWVKKAIKICQKDSIILKKLSKTELSNDLQTLRLALLYSRSIKPQITEEMNVSFVTNKYLLYTALFNLIKNSINSDATHIMLKFNNFEARTKVNYPVKTELSGRFIVIDVYDNGKGFKLINKKLFDPPAQKIKKGFGLYYTAKVCDVLKCSLSLSSEKGAKIVLYHPIYSKLNN